MTPPSTPVFASVAAFDADGRRLDPHPEWAQNQKPPKGMFGPRAVPVSAASVGRVTRQSTVAGVHVSVAKGNVVRVDASRATAAVRARLGSKPVTFSCFELGYDVHHTRAASIAATLARGATFRAVGLRRIDGCEIAGSYGHRWHDVRGTHAPVEVPLGADASRYFERRATARDLALFVRSARIQQARRLSGPALLRALGRDVVVLQQRKDDAPAHAVAVWRLGRTTVFSEESADGMRFYVELRDGKIVRHNLRWVASVF
jgi:hypothetical protein